MDSAPLNATVERWFADFKPGRTITDDARRSGYPIEVENIRKVHKIILDKLQSEVE